MRICWFCGLFQKHAWQHCHHQYVCVLGTSQTRNVVVLLKSFKARLQFRFSGKKTNEMYFMNSFIPFHSKSGMELSTDTNGIAVIENKRILYQKLFYGDKAFLLKFPAAWSMEKKNKKTMQITNRASVCPTGDLNCQICCTCSSKKTRGSWTCSSSISLSHTHTLTDTAER